MRGGPFHRHMDGELVTKLRQAGCKTETDVKCRKGRNTPYVDIVAICFNNHKLLIEIEMTTRRVANDIQKQKDFTTDVGTSPLWIVSPNRTTKLAIDKEIRRLGEHENPYILSGVFCDAIQWISDKKHFCFCVDTDKTKLKSSEKQYNFAMTDRNDNNMLTVQQVADRLSLSCQCVYGLIEAGKLAAHRFGVGRGTIRVSEADLAEFIVACRRETKTPKRKSKPQGRPKLKHISLGSSKRNASWRQGRIINQ